MFRVLLLGALAFVLHRLLRVQAPLAYGAAAVGGPASFSAFHSLGLFGNPWPWPPCLFRFVAGLILTGFYFARGYGITAYTQR